MPTVVFDVSSHGLGHLGQIAPVVHALSARFPKVRVVLRTAHPNAVVHEFIGSPIELDAPTPEAMPVMHDPLIVDAEASAAAFRDLHGRWEDHVARETARLASLNPAALVANVPYLSLAAANRLGIPSLALCSLNWLDVYRAYCGFAHDAPSIMQTIEAAYRSAKVFLQPRPHTPMSDLLNRRSIGPIARMGRRRKGELRRRLRISHAQRLVLFTFGGIRSERRFRLPSIAGVHWLVAHSQAMETVHATSVSQIEWSYIDLLASCDAVVTKVGYGTFVEAACNGVGLVSAARPDWPKSTPLITWATQNADFGLMENGLDDAQSVRAALSRVLEAPRRVLPSPTGIGEAVEIIAVIAGLSG